MYAFVLPLLLCIFCIVTLIWGNTILKPPMYEYEMDANYGLIFLGLLSGWGTYSLVLSN